MRLILVIFLILTSVTAKAEAPAVKSVVNLYGVTFQYGIPPWVSKAENIFKEAKPFRQQRGNDFILEFIPAEETFENWKTIFAVSATRNNRTVPVSLWKDYSLDALKKHCVRYEEEILMESDTTALVKVFCPRVEGAPMPGYSGRVGEIGLFAFMVHGNILINHRIEWRGPSFNKKYPKNWPVQQEELDEAIKLLKAAKAFTPGAVTSFNDD